ncbi:hypothetical protein EST38_g6769 [Candolleomyces aberdarensis]|uniref:Cytochrome P450 n=1 Tax=Candolleomyces aberdarensis TaxID=2316362 RepID=A0A4Q2DHC0_9AGAR|nr:hypothetical protein EST38_g6769 [Candolleomyces aberdarensis]
MSRPALPLSLGVQLGTLVACAFLFWCFRRWLDRKARNPRGLPLPPGPKGLPVVGNLFQLPQKDPWLEYDRLNREYGDLVYLEAVGQPILILGSLERANEILERKSSKYSNRPVLPALEMIDVAWSFSLFQYGPELRHYRKTFHQYFNANVISRYQPILDEEVTAFLRKLHKSPELFLDHTRDLFGYAIMRIAYGFDDPEVNRGLLHDGETMLKAFVEVSLPGRYLVNDIPILRHVPAWFPGAGFKARFAELAQVSQRMHIDSFERVKKNLENGRRSVHPSMAADLVDKMPNEDNPARSKYNEVAQDVCAVAYAAGADTMISTLFALFLALAMHPEVQEKAQKELESVIGSGRLPTLNDQKSLPYISAIVKEISRWHTVAPIGLPHVTAEDDEYNGYFIPKGTYVMANSWAILHDPNVYDAPEKFNPDRFMKDGALDPTVRDPGVAVFGYGRRVCPGRWLSDSTLFLVTASFLSVYNVYPPKDDSGNSIPLKIEVAPALVSTPLPFKCNIRLRSSQHAHLF